MRLRVLPITDLAARLEDRFALLVEGGRTAPARHRTLRATVDWSYELCTQAEQLLWARCAIFAGSFDLGAAEAVCSDEDVPAGTVLDTLASLVDKSILTAEQGGGPRGSACSRPSGSTAWPDSRRTGSPTTSGPGTATGICA